MYNKYISDINNKNDILLSKNFILYKKINYQVYKIYFDIKCLFEYILSNNSNAKIFILFLSFFYFFFDYSKFKLIKGNQKRILFLRLHLNLFSTYSFISYFYYFNKVQDLKDFAKARINFNTNTFFIFFYFIYLKSFLNLYIEEESFLDIVEDNYLFILSNK